MSTRNLRPRCIAPRFEPMRRGIGFVAPLSEPRLEGNGGSNAIGAVLPPDSSIAHDPPGAMPDRWTTAASPRTKSYRADPPLPPAR